MGFGGGELVALSGVCGSVVDEEFFALGTSSGPVVAVE